MIERDEFEKPYRDDVNYKKICNTSIHDIYHLNSELNKYNKYQFSDGIGEALSNKSFIDNCFNINSDETVNHNCKSIKLVNTEVEKINVNLFEALQERRSLRNYTGEKVSFGDLSNLMVYSAGVTGKYEEKGSTKPATNLLAYPLAGGIDCLDVYVSINEVEGIDKGIYLYDKKDNKLNLVNDKYNYNDLTASKSISKLSAFTIYIVGDMEYLGYKYGERGYRFMLTQAGNLSQNIYLVGTALNLGVVASGGYIDDEIKKALSLDNKYVLYEIFVGKVNEASKDPRFVE